jgi:predicted enzyme related to lactoylglutathione lyase
MSTRTKTKPNKSKPSKISSSLVWFEIPADSVARARKFYTSLFGWKIKKFPGPMDYWHIDTAGGNDTPDGGMMPRQHPNHVITNYIAVASLDASMAKVKKLGGTVCMGRTAVRGMGWFAVCTDTENNSFALWEKDDAAK